MRKSLYVVAVSIALAISSLNTSAWAEDAVVDQIGNAQSEIQRLNEQIAINQMNSFNLMRNIEDNSQRQQERAAQAQAESDPQRRQFVQDQINIWNTWAGQAQMELNGLNEQIRLAQERINALQGEIARIQAASVAQVVNATESRNSESSNSQNQQNSPVNPISAIEQQNVAVQGQIDIDQNKTQQQIFDLNAVNFAIQALKPGSQTWAVLVNTKRALEDALDQTYKNIAKNKEILDAQNKVIENIKSLNDATQTVSTIEVKETLTEVSEITSALTNKISENNNQISSINANLAEIDATLSMLDKNDSSYAQLTASRNLLVATLKNFQESSEKLVVLQENQVDIASEAKNQTSLLRTAAVLTGSTKENGMENMSPIISFQKNKLGKYTTKLNLQGESETELAVKPSELVGVTVNLKNSKGTFKLSMSLTSEKNLQLSLPKKISSGKYQLILSAPGKKSLTLGTKISVK